MEEPLFSGVVFPIRTHTLSIILYPYMSKVEVGGQNIYLVTIYSNTSTCGPKLNNNLLGVVDKTDFGSFLCSKSTCTTIPGT